MEGPNKSVDRVLAALVNRITVARALHHAVVSLGVSAIVLGTLLLAARLLAIDFVLAPAVRSALIASAIGIPLLIGVGLAWVRRPVAQDCAVWLDRELRLDGMLLTSYERTLAGWESDLGERLRTATIPNPPFAFTRLRGALGRAALALAFLIGVSLLPERETRKPTVNPMVARSIEDLKQQLAEVAKAEAIEQKAEQDLMARLERLEERSQQGESVPWSDLDDAADALDRAQNEREAELAKAAQELAELADEAAEAASRGEAAEAAVDEKLAEALKSLAEKGLLDSALAGLDAKTAEQLKQLAEALANGTLSPENLTAEQREALANAASNLGQNLDSKLAQALDSRLARSLDPKLAEKLGKSAAAKQLAKASERNKKSGSKKSGSKSKHKHTEACSGGL